MDPRTADRRLTDPGVSTVQFILASAMALVMFTALANLVVVQYGRGALQSALDQASRAGALSGRPTDCELMAADVVSQLLGGRMSDSVLVGCSVEGDLMVARASAVFDSWTPMSPDFAVSMTSVAVVEGPP